MRILTTGQESRAGSRRSSRWLLVANMAMLLAATSCKKAVTVSEQPAPRPVAATTSSSPSLPEPVRKLFGRWVREDGGYVLELRKADMSGVMEAGYFNPKPINVSRAIWMQGANGFQVIVELNDVGYPGATYVLSHEHQTDRLIGKYTQPAMQQSFDIVFTRQPQ
jgi:hypothetical protein